MPARATAPRTSRPSLEQVARRRLAGQHLLRPLEDPASVVAALGAVQAQDYHGAKWALGLRAHGATDATVERAFDEGALLRTHVLRPTWHFVAPSDLRWMLRLTGPRVSRAMAYYNRILELTPDVFRRSHRAIERALRGGRHSTRQELARALREAKVGAVHTQRLAHLVMQAELDGLVCSGPRRGKQFTYALLEERVAKGPAFARDEAMAELARRYFATRGPATVEDFAWWSGLTRRDAREAVHLLGRVAREVVEGVTYFALGSVPVAARAATAFLLPNYDELFIGLKDRHAMRQRLARLPAAPPAQAMFAHVVVIDGQLVGEWRRGGDPRAVRLRLFVPLGRSEERALDAAVRRYGTFLGAEVTAERV